MAAITPGVAMAADFRVTTTADGDDKECALDCTLREAVVLAGSADRVLVPSGTYVLSGGELSLNDDTIVGEDARKTIIDGDAKSRVLRVIEVQSRVSNVTIRNGNGVGVTSGAGGGIFIESGSLLLQNSTVSGNTATTGGGIAAAGTATLIGVTVSGNRASGLRLTRGGGITTSSTGGLLLGNSTVSGNTAADESASSQGGGIYSSGTLAIIASTIANNSAAQGGGLQYVTPPTGAAGSVQNSIVAHGSGGACGGDDFNATASVASDATCQLKDPSNLNNVNPLIGELADNGGPTNTHALRPSSPAVGKAASCATLDQRGFTRVAPCDSGAYEYRAPTLKVVTAVINDSGGTRTPSQFNAHVLTGGKDVTGSPQPGTIDGTTYTVVAGTTYEVAAAAVAGYTLSVSGDCATNGSITLQEGQNRTCTITANDIAPTLRVITTVVNNNGGTAVAANFSAHVRQGGNAVPTSPQAGAGPPGTLYSLSAGTYAVTADGVAGYTPSGSGACNAAGSVTLALGQNVTCTITVDDIPATLRVVTNVVNGSGGTAERDDFAVHVKRNGVEVTGSPQPGAAAPGTAYTLAAGGYQLSADGVAGYAASFSAACTGGTINLALAATPTCTITLEDGAGTLNVKTNVVNDDGGTAGAGAFGVSVRRAGVDVPASPQPGSETGTPYSLAAATYTVAAGGVPGYTYAVTGDCAGDGSVALPLRQTRECTVTANDVAPRLTVVTQVVNDNGGSAAPGSFTVRVRRGGTDVAGSPQPGGPGTAYTLGAGTHVVSADALSGYGSAITGDCAGDGSITLNVGDDKTCTVTANDDPPPVQAQSSQQLPPPEKGQTFNALPKSGTVKVKLPGRASYVPLDQAQQLPVGTIVDATKGHVTLVAAADDSGGTATAEFWAGIFRVGQSKGAAPTTILTLVEKLSCPRSGKASAAAKKKKKRRLWGDGSGKFQTKGKHSAATVVGTRWLVEDKCKSTLTRVVRGRVSVRDFVKKRTVIVRAGKKYVARANSS